MLNSATRARKASKPSAVRASVARFGFSIRTRGGVLMENLFIPGASVEEAERKLMQIYMGCSVIARFVPDSANGSARAQRQA